MKKIEAREVTLTDREMKILLRDRLFPKVPASSKVTVDFKWNNNENKYWLIRVEWTNE